MAKISRLRITGILLDSCQKYLFSRDEKECDIAPTSGIKAVFTAALRSKTQQQFTNHIMLTAEMNRSKNSRDLTL